MNNESSPKLKGQLAKAIMLAFVIVGLGAIFYVISLEEPTLNAYIVAAVGAVMLAAGAGIDLRGEW